MTQHLYSPDRRGRSSKTRLRSKSKSMSKANIVTISGKFYENQFSSHAPDKKESKEKSKDKLRATLPKSSVLSTLSSHGGPGDRPHCKLRIQMPSSRNPHSVTYVSSRRRAFRVSISLVSQLFSPSLIRSATYSSCSQTS